jgi:Zn/Cd-binding protein ZinT
MPIIVYNRAKEDFSNNPNNYPIYRGGSVLGNPYTDKPLSKTMAIFSAKTREEAIEKYADYFDVQYGHNIEFTNIIDEIYEKYKNGETVYLECYCHPAPCHGDVIVKKLQQRLLKEKISEVENRKKCR